MVFVNAVITKTMKQGFCTIRVSIFYKEARKVR
jgi:hypothetical protein